MSTEEKKDLKTIVEKTTRKVLKVTPHYVLFSAKNKKPTFERSVFY